MRQLKFRQYHNGKFHYWGYIDEDNTFTSPVHGDSQQYIGKLDKNSKETFYEGDIVRCIVGSGGDGEKPFQLKGVMNYRDGVHLRVNEYGAWFCHSFEKIGTIHENKELLKEEVS